jgi:steroid delta-isomerase-like uncharacterized protein
MKKFSPLLLFAAILMLHSCTATKKLRLAEENKETVRLWFEEGWNHSRNEELIPRVFHPEWSDGNPLRPDQTVGHEGMRQLVQYYRKAFPDSKFNITHLFGNEQYVAIRYEVSATHVGDAFGIPATGKHFTSTGMVIYEMENNRIKRSWQELDLMGIINQLRE